MNKVINVIAQAFYGNKTATSVNTENLDRFILGYLDNSIPVIEKIDRTIVKVPNTENIVIVYNKYEDERYKNGDWEPLVVIPEENIKLYSRCIVCRIDEQGQLESLQREDFKHFMDYLAD